MASLVKTLLINQPGKGLFALLAITFNLIRLPLWIILGALPFTRQNSKWTMKQSIRVKIVRAFLFNGSIVNMRTPTALTPGKEGDRFVVIQPAKKSTYTGVVDKDLEIQPLPVGATWYPDTFKPADKKTAQIILHFHGGAYVIGDGRFKDCGFLAKTLLANTPATYVFCLQYRLSSNPGGRFPAALQDAISSYSYLTKTLGISPDNITVSGDSAGANLVLALLRYIAEYPRTGLGAPSCGLLWSPWVHPKNAADGQKFDHHPSYPMDYITPGFGEWGAKTLAPSPSSGLTLADPFISFLGQPFKTETPLYVSTGECEVLFQDDTQLANEMESVGNKVMLQVEDRAVHDIILTGALVGFEKEAALAAKRAGTFIASTRRS